MSNKSGRPSASNKPGSAKSKQSQRPQQQRQQPRSQQQKQVQTQNRPTTLTNDSQVLTAERTQQQDRLQEKQQARLQRQAEARAEAARRKRAKTLRRSAIFGAVALVLVGVIGYLVWREASRPGRAIDMMPSYHIEGAYNAPYNSDPPTSGPHNQSVPAFIVYTQPLTKELQIHGLEDGGVVINYTPDTDQTTIDRLKSLAESYHNIGGSKGHVILAPYAEKFRDSNAKIALTAWRRIDLLDTYDEQRIRRFIDEYVGIDRHGESGT